MVDCTSKLMRYTKPSAAETRVTIIAFRPSIMERQTTRQYFTLAIGLAIKQSRHHTASQNGAGQKALGKRPFIISQDSKPVKTDLMTRTILHNNGVT